MPTVEKSTPITWTVGDVRITRISELEVHWPFAVLLPGAEDLIDDYDWLRPDFVTDDGRMRLSMHSLVVESAGMRIVVDTCVGNDKSRPGAPPFEQLSTPFLEDLTAAGFAPRPSTPWPVPTCTWITSAGTRALSAASGCPRSATLATCS